MPQDSRVPRCLPSLLLLLFLAAGAEAAQPPSASEEEQRLEEVVVTAARMPEALGRTAAAVTVIRREELEERQVRTVAEALRDVPSLSVVQSGTPGSVTSVFARGGNSSHTLVLMDGVRVNSPNSGLFDFANLTTEGVERIEVVRGPASALYGSDALTTVVNIITRKGEGAPRASVRAEYGSYQTFREQAESRGRLGPVGYSVDVGRTDTGGKFAHDEYNNTSGAARLDVQAAKSLALDLTARYTHTFKNLPAVPGRFDFLLSAPDPGQSSREDFTVVTLGATHTPTPWWDHRLQGSVVLDDLDFRDPLGFNNTSDTETMRLALDWQHTLRPVSWDTFSAGVTVDQAKGSRTNELGVEDLNRTVLDYAFYAQNQATLWERLILTMGARVDENSAFGTHVTPRFLAALLLHETGSKLRASYGEGFRAPSINDLAFPGLSNATLHPEKNRSLEFGVDQSLWKDRIRASVTWFQSRFRDLIQLQFSGGAFIPVNVAHARTRGVETSLGFHPGYGVDLIASYTYLASRDDSDRALLRRPANTWSASLNYAPWNRLNLNTRVLYVGKRADIDPVTFDRTTNFKYVKWDATASMIVAQKLGILRKLTAFGKLENILGDRHEEVLGFPALGRSYLIGLAGDF